jgi:hypothetical protein
MPKQFLNLNGLTTYDTKIKEYIASHAVSGGQSDWTETDTSDPSYIQHKPTLGTASSKDVATSGNASSTQVVMGNDTRLEDEIIEKTYAEYQALSSAEKNNGKYYHITDRQGGIAPDYATEQYVDNAIATAITQVLAASY